MVKKFRAAMILFVAVAIVERVLDELEAARTRVELRRFRREHPEVRWYYPDGERGD